MAIYTRVSTTRQKTENQLVQLWKYVARMGWSVAGIQKETEHGQEPERGVPPPGSPVLGEVTR